jgi:hypothetical protein
MTLDDFFTHNKEDSKIKVDEDFCLKVINTRNRLILFYRILSEGDIWRF